MYKDKSRSRESDQVAFNKLSEEDQEAVIEQLSKMATKDDKKDRISTINRIILFSPIVFIVFGAIGAAGFAIGGPVLAGVAVALMIGLSISIPFIGKWSNRRTEIKTAYAAPMNDLDYPPEAKKLMKKLIHALHNERHPGLFNTANLNKFNSLTIEQHMEIYESYQKEKAHRAYEKAINQCVKDSKNAALENLEQAVTENSILLHISPLSKEEKEKIISMVIKIKNDGPLAQAARILAGAGGATGIGAAAFFAGSAIGGPLGVAVAVIVCFGIIVGVPETLFWWERRQASRAHRIQDQSVGLEGSDHAEHAVSVGSQSSLVMRDELTARADAALGSNTAVDKSEGNRLVPGQKHR